VDKTAASLFTYAVLVVFWQLTLLITVSAFAVPTVHGWVVVEFSTRRRTHVPVIWDAKKGTRGQVQKMKEVYTSEGFVEVEEGDVVVDVGAYIGTFTLVAARDASRVVAVDPFSLIDNSLVRNTRTLENVVVVPKGAWNSNGSMDMNLSLFPNDNSLIEPDTYSLDFSVCVEVSTVPDIVGLYDLDHIDFLKIEAEGVEPEVLEGAFSDTDTSVDKVVVNCAAEREGDSPTEDVTALLERHGYTVRVGHADAWDADMVYARRE
jgi:FkbM family methyltransferase